MVFTILYIFLCKKNHACGALLGTPIRLELEKIKSFRKFAFQNNLK